MAENHFLRLYALGYTRLVPITPPDAKVSERSSLFKRVGTDQDGRGKTPGVKWSDGTWSGFDWIPCEAAEADLLRWHDMGAGIGVKTGQGLIFVDSDTPTLEHAKIVKEEAERFFGHLFPRIGREPKWGFPLRTSPDFRYCRIEFGERDAKGRLRDRVEILSDGKQFVAHGVHPGTKKPYRWPQGSPPVSEIPFVEPEVIHAFLSACAARLPAASAIVQEGAPTDVDQAALKGDLDLVRAAVAATPNTSALFPTREAYRDMGYAIKAATIDHPADGLSIYQDWCARWTDGDNDPDIVEADWSRMKPPFRRGASWLFETATANSDTDFSAAAVSSKWFDAAPVGGSIFPPDEPVTGPETTARAIRATPHTFVEPAAIAKREWLYGQHYIRNFISTTVAPSGVGKTALTIVEFLAMASGKPLLGIQPAGCFRVWLWNGEDPRDELSARIAAAMQHYGLTPEDMGDRLFIDTGRETEIVLGIAGRDGARIVAPVASAIVGQMLEHRIDAFGVDPFVSSHRVPENDNGAIDLVAKQWAKIADATHTAIELVHHVRKLNGSEITVEDGRGAVALLAAARPKRALAGMTKAEATRFGVDGSHYRFFRIGDERNNLALPAGETASWFELKSVPLGNGAGLTPVEKIMNGDSVGVVTVYEGRDLVAAAAGGEDEKAVVLGRIGEGEWRRDIRAGDAWAGVVIAQAFNLDIDDAADKARAKAILSDWIKRGVLKETSRPDAHRKLKSYVVCGETDNMGGNGDENAFE